MQPKFAGTRTTAPITRRCRLVLVALILALLPQAPLWAQSPDQLAQLWANNRLVDQQLQNERKGPLSRDYADRAQANQEEFLRLEQQLSKLSPDAYKQVRAKANLIYNQRILTMPAAPPPAQSPGNPPPVQPTNTATHSIMHYWWVLLIAVAGIAGMVLRRRTMNGSSRATSTPPVRRRSPPPPAEPILWKAAPPTPATAPVGAPPMPPAGATARERVLAQAKYKYQAGITAAMDALTETQLELQQNAAVPEAIRSGLQKFGALVYSTTQEALHDQVSKPAKALMEAVLLLPVFRGIKRLFGKGGLLFKIALGYGLFLLFSAMLPRQLLFALLQALPTPIEWLFATPILLMGKGFWGVFTLYVIAVVITFFLSRRAQTHGAMQALDKSAAALKAPRLLYYYAGQVPTGVPGKLTYQMLRISAASDQPAAEDVVVSNQSDPNRAGNFVLAFEGVTEFQKPAGGALTPAGITPGNKLMQGYGAIVSEVVQQYAEQLEPLYLAMARYGDLKWQQLRRSADIPRAQKLLSNVSQLEKVWQSAYVADPVFEFLIKRIDLFNMRDSATPNGILLCGPAGVGKEFLARKIAESAFAQFVKPTAEQLAAPRSIKELWAAQSSRAPVVLFIEYADQVFAPAGVQDGAGRDATLAWLDEWSQHEPRSTGIWVVMSALKEEALHPRVLAMIGGSKVQIKPPDAAGRELVLAAAVRDKELAGSAPRWLIDATQGLSVRDLYAIVSEVRTEAGFSVPTDANWRTGAEPLIGRQPLSGEELEKVWGQIVLKPEIKTEILDKIGMFARGDKMAPRGMLLYGPPGTGKTLIAERIAESAGCAFFPMSIPDLKGAYLGQTGERVRTKWEEARKHRRAVMFIDECEGVFGRRGGLKTDQFTEDLVQAFLAEWDGFGTKEQQVWVIGATNKRDLLDEAIVSRFESTIEIGQPGPAERLQILRLEMKKSGRALDVPEFAGAATTGMSGRNLAALARAICTQAEKQGGVASEETWREAIGRVKGVKLGGDRWESLILGLPTLNQLKTVSKSLMSLESLRSQGVPLPKGALLYGPPGTGKTQIAKTLANESGLPIIAPITSDLKGAYTGQSGQKTRELFERARGVAPCILFIDEIDAVCPPRGGAGSDSFTEEIVNQILHETEGANATSQGVYLLGATNRLEAVDSAIRSRLKSTIEVPLPDEDQRREMMKVFLRRDKLKVDFDIDAAAAEAAHGTKRMGGRALLGLLERASQHAVDRAFANGTPDNIVLTLADLRAELQPPGRQPGPEEMRKIWDQIVLKPEVKAGLMDKINRFARGGKTAPRGMLLYGPPGTGKTEIARRIADSAGCKFLPLKSSDLKSGYVGGSGQFVKKTWEQARSYDSCVMFVDECEGVFARRGGTNTDSASEELVQAFLSEWDGFGTEDQRVWVIGATNRRDILDEAIVSRFGDTIEIGLPGAAERAQILALEIKKMERAYEVPPFVGAATTGMAGRQLATLARELCAQADSLGAVPDEALWRDTIKRLKATGDGPTDGGNDTWDNLILAAPSLNQLKSVARSLQMVESLRSHGVPLPTGALLYGPPGTGKTQIAKTLAHESGLPMLAPTTSELKAGYLGQSAQKTREMFERARGMAPCILFIDEIDAVCPVRGGGSGDSFTEDIIDQILQETEGVKAASSRCVYLLGATNRLESVDPAIRSRLKTTIEIPLPDADQRRQLLKVFLTKGKLKVDFDVDAAAQEVSQQTPNLGGRALSGLVERAAQRAVDRALAAGTPDRIVLTLDDLRAELQPQRKPLTPAELDKVWGQIVLKSEVKAEVLAKVGLFARGDAAAPRGMLLYGPPGTGKTLIAERIAESAGCKFLPLKSSDLKSDHIGGSGQFVKKIWAEARSYPRCVMFIDECEGVFARRGGTDTDSASVELVQAFLAEWDGFGTKEQKVWVIGATNRRDILDEAIVQRFGSTIEIGQPGAAERAQIVQLEVDKLGRSLQVPAFVGAQTNGLSGRQLATLAREVCSEADKPGTVDVDGIWRAAIARLATAGNSAVKKSSRWESLVLPEDLLERLRSLCNTLRNAEEYKEQGFEVPSGALLFGPPGTGKTEIANTLANESGLPFLAASAADLKAGFTGQSGQKTRELFQRARGSAPCIVFIDAIDSVCPTRGGRGADTFTDEIVTQMQTEMSSVAAAARPVFVLAATSRPEAIDPAIKSRFEEQIPIDYPDGPQRQRLFKQMFGRLPVDFDRDAVATELADMSEETSGGDIQGMVRRASQRAVRRSGGNAKAALLTRADLLSEVAAPRAV